MFLKILNFIKITIVGILILLFFYNIYINDLFFSENIFSIGKKQELGLKDYDKEGKLNIVVWGMPAHPEIREYNCQLPIREWEQMHRRHLLYMEMMEEFERRNPNINIIVEYGREWYSDMVFISQVGANSGPDVFFNMNSSMVPTLARRGFIINLDEYVNKWERKNDFREILWLPNMYAGHFYAVPDVWQNWVVGLIYRKDLLIKAGFVDENKEAVPPKSWEDMNKYGQKLYSPKKQLYCLGFDACTGTGGWNLQDYIWQAGGEIVKKTGNKWEAVFASEAVLKALEYIRDLKYKYKALHPDIGLSTWGGLPNCFSRGEIVMYKAYQDDYFSFLSKGYLSSSEVGFAPLPKGPAGSIAQCCGGGWVVTKQVNNSKKMRVIWKLFEFLTSDEMIIHWVKRSYELGLPLFRYGTALKKFDELDYIPECQEVPHFLEILEKAKIEPYCDNYSRIKGEILSDLVQIALIDPNIDLKKVLVKYQIYANKYLLGEEKERK